ncbi:serine protease ['Osedax' symbiont bacterium Rs2_46_30_T18]|nr:serine protease ['Osedax' symbiont bacterium Rs2_46_30_T18]
MLRIIFGILLLCPLLLSGATHSLNAPSVEAIATPVAVQVPVLAIDGAIGPAVSDYLVREIDRAHQQPLPPAIFITIDTPGGLSSSLRDINQRILSSDIPIVCLVHPQGARAASAGTYILYACHVAAMARATTLGAATPVMIGGPMPSPTPQKGDKSKPTAMENKVLNDSVAYIRSLAQLRKRNQQWAELAVTEAATLTAIEALEKNVINIMAQSPEQLLTLLSDPQLPLVQGLKLQLSGASLDYRQPDWRSQFIATITDPNIAYLLMLAGVYGLLLEFYSPGMGVAGVIGGISLVIAMYAFQMLPLNYAGLGLILLGIAFLVVETMIPSFGVFGIGGIVAFVVGSIFLIDTQVQEFKVSLMLIMPIALLSSAFILFVLGYLWRSREKQVVSGQEAILGASAYATSDFSGMGKVIMGGECWAAYSPEDLKKGQIVSIEAIEGLTLIVSSKNRGG